MYKNEHNEVSRYDRTLMRKASTKLMFDKTLRPTRPLSILNPSANEIKEDHFAWFGHSFLLIRAGALTILVDPVLDNKQFPLCACPRYDYSPQQVIPSVEVDVALISHNHYDHLDPKYLHALNPKLIIAPRDNARYLVAADREKVVELAWNQSYAVGDCAFTLVPSRHFSSRGIRDRDMALWGGFVIAWPGHSVYYSGDTGYSEPNISTIKQMFPQPFDVMFLECGYYGEGWPDTHIFPDQFIYYANKIQATVTIPVHYGKFHLNAKRWCSGVEDVYAYRDKLTETRLKIMQIGEVAAVGAVENKSSDTWWQNV